ncbi:MAG: hypothetical protein ABEJ81_03930 [Haloferacaceae archaeon]
MDGDDGRRLAVEADLDVAVDGDRVRVEGDGDLLVIDAPSFAAARALHRGVEALPAPLSAPLLGGGPALDVRVRGTSVARVGPDVDPGPVAALFGTAPARPSLVGVLRALLRG